MQGYALTNDTDLATWSCSVAPAFWSETTYTQQLIRDVKEIDKCPNEMN